MTIKFYINNGRGSIELSNCTIYNNIVLNGGGVFIELYNESGSSEFSKWTIYNNTAKYGGEVPFYCIMEVVVLSLVIALYRTILL